MTRVSETVKRLGSPTIWIITWDRQYETPMSEIVWSLGMTGINWTSVSETVWRFSWVTQSANSGELSQSEDLVETHSLQTQVNWASLKSWARVTVWSLGRVLQSEVLGERYSMKSWVDRNRLNTRLSESEDLFEWGSLKTWMGADRQHKSIIHTTVCAFRSGPNICLGKCHMALAVDPIIELG